jgi:hypothetical protein
MPFQNCASTSKASLAISATVQVLPTIYVPKLNCPHFRRPWLAIRKVELMAKIIVKIKSVVDDVSLID